MQITISKVSIIEQPCYGYPAYGYRKVLADGMYLGELHWYSSVEPYCELSGEFVPTLPVVFGGHTILQVDKCEARYFEQDKEGNLVLTVKQFRELWRP